MIIVSGKLYVETGNRDAYLADCRAIMETARATDGCSDFHLTADPLEDDRINVFEMWESKDALEKFRGSGPPSAQAAQIRAASVHEYMVTSSEQLA